MYMKVRCSSVPCPGRRYGAHIEANDRCVPYAAAEEDGSASGWCQDRGTRTRGVRATFRAGYSFAADARRSVCLELSREASLHVCALLAVVMQFVQYERVKQVGFAGIMRWQIGGPEFMTCI